MSVVPDDPEGLQREFEGFAYHVISPRLKRGKVDIDSCGLISTRLSERLTAAIEQFKKEGARIDCKARCTWCCSLRVEILPYEAIALVRFIKNKLPEIAAALEEKILANEDRIRRLTPEQHRSTNMECALLVEGKCSVYPVRPMLCAGHHSSDVVACETGFNQPDKEEDSIPEYATLVMAKAFMMTGAAEALKVGKLKAQSVELHTALAALMRDWANTVNAWRSGGNLVKGAPDLGPTSIYDTESADSMGPKNST
ncbi:MAG TPA: YkgJ family cysteine cluster protein [Steroidobacteraceae bacterium]|nr:YkgJ family cysteine cluster protein [Steroidobacteraceae bacterium]